jgi:N utilization substance protein B
MTSQTRAARSKARRFALQALYQVQLTGCSTIEAERQFLDDHDMRKVDTVLLHKLLFGIDQHRQQLIEVISPHLHIPFEKLDPVEKATILIGAFELCYSIEVPYKVVINESIELVKRFGATESHKFVNPVLDRVAAEQRPHESGRDEPGQSDQL